MTMFVKTGRPEFDNLIPLIKGFLEKDILDVNIDGEKIRGYRFADNQARNGRIFDYFTTFPEKLPYEKENWTKYVRVPVEADVEYRFIKAAWLSWQATGDDDFLKELLPCFERALSYIMHSWYWDNEKFLVILSPRWEAAGVKEAEVFVEYPASHAFVRYNYLYSGNTIKMEIEGNPEDIMLQLYLPEMKRPKSVNSIGADVTVNDQEKQNGRYLKCRIRKFKSPFELTIKLSGR
jgi:hypothetical protein